MLGKLRGKPFALWVIFGALVYTGFGLLALVLLIIAAGFAIIVEIAIIAFVFIALLVAAGVASLTGARPALIGAVAVSVAFLYFFSPQLASSLSNPAQADFWLAVSSVPALILAIVFSILSLARWKRGISQTPYLASPRSGGGLLTLAVVGFVIGGLVIGNVAATTITRILGGAGTAADIQIVRNAADAATAAPFSPATFTVSVGDTVTWYNSDTMEHSVTSDAGTPVAFDSGLVKSGDSFSFTFSEVGTYAYHCTPHPWMTGTIVVNP